MRRLAAAALLVIACVATVVLTGARGNGTEKGKTIKIAFDNAFGLTEGGELRVGGVKAGKTETFTVSKGPECQLGHQNSPPRACAVVTASLTELGLSSFRTDSNCSIRQQSLIGEYYVDCQPGGAKAELAPGEIIPDTRTSSTIPADLVGDILRRPYRDRFRLILAELGTGLAGRPDDLAMLLHHAHPGLRATDQTLKILANQRTIIKNFISNSDKVVAQLDQKKRDVARWIREAGRTAEISATRRTELAAGFQKLPRFLDELRPTMARLGELTDAQRPLLSELQAASPQLTTFFQRLGPFSNASRPAVRSLGSLSVVGNKALRDSHNDISTLNSLAKDAPATAKPLRQFLQTLDSRKRAVDNDPRAAQTAPPAPDPTRASNGGKFHGFTGFEGVLNYFYWQTLAINEFDSISHYLRVLGIVDQDCSKYQADLRPASMGGKNPNADAVRTRCNSYLGPTQPGVTSPDPTAGGKTASASVAKANPTAPRGPGQPEAPALPGKPDYSQPHPTLAPSVQGLLNALTPGSRSATPAPAATPAPQQTSSGDPSQMLDYLLGP